MGGMGGVALADCTDASQMGQRGGGSGEEWPRSTSPLGGSERRCAYPTSRQGRRMELLPQQVHPERSTFPASMSSTCSSICQVRGLAAVWWTLPVQPPLPETYLYACLGGFLSRCFYSTVSRLVQPGVTNGVLLSGYQPPKWKPHQGEEVPHPKLEGLQGLTPRVTLSSG